MKNKILDIIIKDPNFASATFKGTKYKKIQVRPVNIKQIKHLQFSYFDQTKDITKNYSYNESLSSLEDIFNMCPKYVTIETTNIKTEIQFLANNKFNISEKQISKEIDLTHNKKKEYFYPSDIFSPILYKLGIQTQEGLVKPTMRDKFIQINEFLKLALHLPEIKNYTTKPLNILDCGAGSAYLTFAIHDYFSNNLNLQTNTTGIDTKEDLIIKNNKIISDLNIKNINFINSKIINYVPTTKPDLIIGLHACDTATDEILHKAIQWDTQFIMVAPCCHHNINKQLQKTSVIKSILQYSILKERFADLLTDTLRAQILQINGYTTDIIEFVSSSHTNRNLMLRAQKKQFDQATLHEFQKEYQELKSTFHVTPYLEKLGK